MAVVDEHITFNINNPMDVSIDQIQAHDVELSKLLLDKPDKDPRV